MAFKPGQVVTAGQLNRLQPSTYEGVASGDLVGPATNGDVPGATVTFSTLAANAIFVVVGFADFDTTGGGTTTVGTARCVVDGAAQAGLITYQDGSADANDRSTPGQVWRGVLASAGSHTIKLQGTVASGMEINTDHTKLLVTIYEVV